MSTNKIEGSHLKQHAPSLVKILSILRRENPNLTADELWGRMKRFWDVPYLELALQEFDASRGIKLFLTLLVFEKERQSNAEGVMMIEGAIWTTASNLTKSVRLTATMVRRKLKNSGIKVERGINYGGKACNFYILQEVEKVCNGNSLHANKGEMIEVAGEKIGSLETLARELGSSKTILLRTVKEEKIPYIVNLWHVSGNRAGKSFSHGYRLSEVMKALPSSDALQISSKQTVKVKGVRYITIRAYIAHNSIPINENSLKGRVDKGGVKGIPVIILPKKIRTLAYTISELDKLCAEFKIQGKVKLIGDGICVYRKKKWATHKAICEKYAVDEDAMRGVIVRRKTPYITAYLKGKGIVRLYDMNRVDKDLYSYLMREKRKNDPIDSAVLRAEAVILVTVLKTLRSKVPDFTADDLWHALRTKWPKSELDLALKEFKESGKTDRFKTLFM